MYLINRVSYDDKTGLFLLNKTVVTNKYNEAVIYLKYFTKFLKSCERLEMFNDGVLVNSFSGKDFDNVTFEKIFRDQII